MKKWVFFFLALILVVNFVTIGIGCKGKEEPKPAAKEEVKPPEAPAPAQEPAPAPEKPEEKPAEAPKK